MALEISGKLIVKQPVQQISDTFKKREFVIELTEQSPTGMTFTNFASFQLMQDKVTLIDQFNEGDDLKVSFNIRGNKWEKDGVTKYITNLNAWRVEKAGMDQAFQQAPPAQNFNAAPQQPNAAPQQSFNQPQQPNFNPNPGGTEGTDLPF